MDPEFFGHQVGNDQPLKNRQCRVPADLVKMQDRSSITDNIIHRACPSARPAAVYRADSQYRPGPPSRFLARLFLGRAVPTNRLQSRLRDRGAGCPVAPPEPGVLPHLADDEPEEMPVFQPTGSLA